MEDRLPGGGVREVTHTPGPWRVGDPTIGWENSHEVIAEVDGRKKVILSANINFLEQGRADALLASAAPEMYSAIKEYLEWGPMTGSDRDLHEGAFRAAIAKAEQQK